MMSFINFESSRVKEAERRDRKEAREIILKKAEADYHHRKDKEERARLRGDDRWMLPSVEEKIKRESKKEKKKHKKKKKNVKKKKSSSSDSDESSDEEQWVEKDAETSKKTSNEKTSAYLSSENVSKETDKSGLVSQRDEWMTLPGLFPCVSREQIRQQSGHISKKEEQKQKEKYMLDTLGQSDRELNPYWKDGGTGLPQDREDSKHSRTLPTKAVGDYGVDWLRRALQRTKEQAAEQGRSVEAVAAERWGSLANLEEMLAEAEERSRSHYKYSSGSKYEDRSDWRKDKHDKRSSKSEGVFIRKSDNQTYSDRHDKIVRTFQRPKEDESYRHETQIHSPSEMERKSSRSFQKPQDDRSFQKFRKPEESSSTCDASYRKQTSSGNWRKKVPESSKGRYEEPRKEISRKKSSSSSSSSDAEDEKKVTDSPVMLTDKEMNELGAKLVKAEILGNEKLAEELKKKLNAARAARTTKPSVSKTTEPEKEEVVILTKTDSRGFAHPLQQSGEYIEPAGGRRRKQKSETHVDGKRVRYYADDDKYSLKDLFEREKLSTVEDENLMFSKLAAKGVGRTDSEYDMDDVFAEQVRQKESDGKVQARERGRAVREHKMVEKVLDHCNRCFDSKEMLKHLIIAIGSKVYLCLPPYQSLTEGHCLIVPMYHIPCATQLDEDVWDEVQTFRRTLTSMFRDKLDLDVVFYETAMYLHKFPHMVIECVPMPRETGDMAPIYFKKAILECETEWAINKKLVDLKGKDVRRAVPKGLPYFAVDFGLDSGFAHVIEDEKMFPRNFAQEIIGGMLDLDHSLWRKQRRENFDMQRKKVLKFSEWWKPYDFTVKKQDSSDSD